MRSRRMLLIAAVFSLLLGAGLAIPAVADRGSSTPPSGTWERDLFGSGNVSSVVYSTVVDGKVMNLDLTVTTPDGVTYRVERDDNEGDDDEREIEILFSDGQYQAKLKVKAEWDDDRPKVKFKFQGDERAPEPGTGPTVSIVPASGGHTWAGQLCNGQPFTIAYSINGEGVTITGVDGPPSRVQTSKNGRRARVYFDDVDARITVSVKGDRGNEMRIDAKLGRCDGGVYPPTTVPPTTTTGPPNTGSTTTTATGNTTSTTAPPTTPAPTTVPTTTTPPTTPPQRQAKYLTYKLPIGEVVVFLDEPAALENWAVNTPGWTYYTPTPGPTEVKIGWSNDATNEQAELKVTLSGNTVTASFKSDSGGTITPAPPTESTVAPAKTLPSG